MSKDAIYPKNVVPSHTSCVSLVPIFNHLEKEQLDEIKVTTQSVSYKNRNLFIMLEMNRLLFILFTKEKFVYIDYRNLEKSN